ncbi:response regulator transcription factor [Nocardioides zeae]|uniref:Response regulator transcription factor n=1 Tax=Nocardioides imazamoxiresistens TaxID=3231893 RepID=A0ABU3PZA2_9ACTN|nr:response regulator transcription factor [Nocardioides zeae]MDT9594132.1 response regulator transcription factor [Nocardioides zeae]
MSSPVQVFLLDDHEVVRRGLRALLESGGDLRVVGEAGTYADGLIGIRETAPDVAVLDARLPDGSGIELCREVKSENPGLRALILTSYDDDEALQSAILAGADGYVLKEIGGNSLISGIRAVADGHSLIDPVVAVRAMERIRAGVQREVESDPSALTPQQQRILGLIGEGLTNREIADQLFLSEKTVKNHITHLLARLGVKRRTQAALIAAQMRLPESRPER